MESFKQFIEQYKNEDSVVGDFACDVIRAGDFPSDHFKTDAEEYKTISDYLRFKRASSSAVKVFREAYSTYLVNKIAN